MTDPRAWSGLVAVLAGVALLLVGQMLAVELVRALGGAVIIGGLVLLLVARVRRE